MNGAPDAAQLFFILDPQEGLLAFRETLAPWAGLMAFSSEELARQFCRDSDYTQGQLAAIDSSDEPSLRAIIRQVKLKGIRYLLLDLDYREGTCIRYELEQDWFGSAKSHRFERTAH